MREYCGMRRAMLTSAAILAWVAAACGSGADTTPAQEADRRGDAITVASFAFSESRVLAEIYAQVLESQGLSVRRAFELASREVVEPALEQGKVDLVPEYVGTALRFLEPRQQADDAYAALSRAFAARGVTVLAPAPAENKNGIVVTAATARRLRLTKISDLAPVARNLVFGGPPECPERPLCLPGLRSTYGLSFKQFRALDAGGPATVAALEGGEVDVALLFTTDGHLTEGNFVLLADDKGLQPAENVVPVVRASVLERHGDTLRQAVDGVSRVLTTDQLVNLNRQVDVDGESPRQAARSWLARHGLD